MACPEPTSEVHPPGGGHPHTLPALCQVAFQGTAQFFMVLVLDRLQESETQAPLPPPRGVRSRRNLVLRTRAGAAGEGGHPAASAEPGSRRVPEVLLPSLAASLWDVG